MANPTTKQELIAAMMTAMEEAKALLQQSHKEMLRLAKSFSEEELFTKGYYKVTYTTSMAAYFLSVTPDTRYNQYVLPFAKKKPN